MANWMRRGFSIVDLAGVLVGTALLAATAGAFVGWAPEDEGEEPDEATLKSRAKSKQLKDATHVRAIHQSMVLFALNNKDEYPVPSKFDISGDTVTGTPESKDTTSNIYSILVYQGLLPIEMLVSPLETNKKIQAYGGFVSVAPPTAVNPKKALWDPAFNADFTLEGKNGGASYAHAMPFKGRLGGIWANSFDSSHAVVSTRGPEISNVVYDEENKTATMTLAKLDSRTLHFFDAANEERKEGEPVLWRGNIAYNDNHVDLLASKYGNAQVVTAKDVTTYRFSEGRLRPDILFYDEDPNPQADNQFLGIFVSSGKLRADWKSIWD